ncbi:hypothetical protein [Oscillatoria salina]|uniref:hypothetical protein n=1 Tax=Oscillatoria salina TaxID=331517 RepID=UPI0013B5B8E3|nr:hypothetical protein [Oscillatoria salina]MBZ8182171.1 hypothetical protein [Oscillatoria salina IIICB1]NET90839.1 hypothetical protein [Kamptonema sp. SIO1D9]
MGSCLRIIYVAIAISELGELKLLERQVGADIEDFESGSLNGKIKRIDNVYFT